MLNKKILHLNFDLYGFCIKNNLTKFNRLEFFIRLKEIFNLIIEIFLYCKSFKLNIKIWQIIFNLRENLLFFNFSSII
jgi:hypothetical protein